MNPINECKTKDYTLIFLFTKDEVYPEVLLQLKNRGPYPGKLNGVGGKIEPDEDPIAGAIREVREETGADVSQNLFRYASLTYYHTQVNLHVFFALVDKTEVHQIEDEPLRWTPVHDVLKQPDNPSLAGNGNTYAFIKDIIDLILPSNYL